MEERCPRRGPLPLPAGAHPRAEMAKGDLLLSAERGPPSMAVNGAVLVCYTNAVRTKTAPITYKSEKSGLTVTFRSPSAEQFISKSPLIHRCSYTLHPCA